MPQVVLLDKVGDGNAHGKQDLRGAIDADAPLRVVLEQRRLLLNLPIDPVQLGDRLVHAELSVGHRVVHECD